MTAPAMAAGIARELERIVGAEHVEHDEARLRTLAIDDVLPQAAVAPGDPQQVAEVLKYAQANDLLVVPAGGCTQQGTGSLFGAAEGGHPYLILRTTRLTAVEHYDAGDLMIGIGAGTTVGEVERMVGKHNQLFPLDIAEPERGTIGGALATNLHGLLKHCYGGLRDYCTGVRFVTADGKIAKAGARVVKNVAGYDLVKLLIGSYGTLAVITSASFKLFPKPRQMRTFLATFGALREAIAFRDSLLRSALPFLAMEVASPHAGALMGEAGQGRMPHNWKMMLRAAGSDAVLARYRRELGSIAREVVGSESDAIGRGCAQMLRRLRQQSPNAMLLRVDVAVADVEAALVAAERAAVDNNFVAASAGRAGIGALLVAFLPVAQPVATHYAGAVSAFRSLLPSDASAVVLRCPLEAKREMNVWGTTPTDVEAMRAIKRAFDSNDTLNRGRFLF